MRKAARLVKSPDDAIKMAKNIDFPQGYGIELGGASRDQAADLFLPWASP